MHVRHRGRAGALGDGKTDDRVVPGNRCPNSPSMKSPGRPSNRPPACTSTAGTATHAFSVPACPSAWRPGVVRRRRRAVHEETTSTDPPRRCLHRRPRVRSSAHSEDWLSGPVRAAGGGSGDRRRHRRRPRRLGSLEGRDALPSARLPGAGRRHDGLWRLLAAPSSAG